jgi:hypothetical protein
MIDTPLREPQDSASDSHPSAAIRTGVYTGALLIIVTLGALVAANRLPLLEKYALERNAACYALFVMLMLVPVVRFLNRPLQMFGAAMVGWVIFVAAYDLMGLYFRDLFQVFRTPFQALVEGAIVYAIFAVGSWVCGMLLHARRHPMAPDRGRAARAAARHSR